MASSQVQAGKKLKAVADRSACCGYGICADICPEIYKLDANGIVVIEGDGAVPPELEQKAREGAEACPQNALKVVEVE